MITETIVACVKCVRLLVVALGVTALLVASSGMPQTSQDSGLAKRRAAHLRYGINLSEWFLRA